MFFQPPDEEPYCNKTTSNTFQSNTNSRRQKKLRRKNKLKAIKKLQVATTKKVRTPVRTVAITMSTWAEDFTKAATWQLKHEVAFWKSKALALEHENKILHRTIRQNSIEGEASPEIPESPDSEDDWEKTPLERRPYDEELEVSEEYIQFLLQNQRYRDFAKQERERIKTQNDVEGRRIAEMEAAPADHVEDHQATLKKLYGNGWERISALEMSLKTEFISICDQDKPMYWPNIPFNFNFC